MSSKNNKAENLSSLHSEEKFKSMAEKAPVSIISFDKNGIIDFVNEYHLVKFGKGIANKDYFIGKNIRNLTSNVSAKISEEFDNILKGNSIELIEIFIPKFTGEQSGFINLRGVPVFENSEIIGGIVIQENITELKKTKDEMKDLIIALRISQRITEDRSKDLAVLNTQLSEYSNQLKEVNASKDKFFSIISHDLKSPLQGLLGISKIMSQEIETMSVEEAVDNSRLLYHSAEHLHKLLENLLQWSRVQLGSIEYNPDNQLLFPLVKNNIDLLLLNAKQKDIQIINEIPDDMSFYADINMVNTVIRNLLTNAIKFSFHGGTIIVSAKNINGNFMEVKIKDNGCGMDEERVKKLFDIGSNKSTPGTDNEKGTGLGLLLCKDLIKKNGGSIWAESSVGRGTRFYFTLQKKKL